MIRYLLALFIFLNFVANLSSQTDLRIGEWESHLPGNRANWVTQSNTHVYISTGYSIIKLDKNSISSGDLIQPEYLTKIDGLTESKISKITFDKFNNQLIIIYTNSNIDIIQGGEVINIPFIKDNTNLVGDRSINDIHISNGSTAYLAGTFGVIDLNLQNLEFRYTTFTPSEVQTVTTDNSKVYIGLDDGLYAIDKTDANPIDFSRWNFQGGSVGLPALYDCSLIESYNGEIYAKIDNALFKTQSGIFQPLDVNIPSGYEIWYITAEGEHLLVGLKNPSSFRAELRAISENGNIRDGGAGCASDVIYGIEDESNRVWYADGFRGIRYTNGIDFGCEELSFNGPRALNSSQIEVGKDKVFFASGGASDNYALLSNRDGIYILENNDWNNVNQSRYAEIGDSFYLNFVSVAPDPDDNVVWMGSYYSGVVSYNLDTEALEFFDGSNSSIEGINPDDKRGRVAYLEFDRDDNLWVANFGSEHPIVLKTKEGAWLNFEIPYTNTNLAKMAIDDRGYIWFTVIGNSGGVLVYDPGEQIVDPNDDRFKLLTRTNSAIPSALVNSLAVDNDGDVWIGTSEGPVSFECDPFDEGCDASRRKVLQDSIAAFLLQTEEIISIEIDGANRKWFGTKNGIFVQTADAEEQVALFNEDNSPIFSNTIIDMDFEPNEGRMYISTDNGIQSFRTASTGAEKRHDRKVFAFPNPVTPEYQGPIAIKGLGRNANVKITDLSGKLVYETTALGGQATWDGRDYTGRKAATGVYLVFSSSRVSFDTSDEYVTKIMLLD